VSITGTIRQDRTYPMVGDAVTLAVDGVPRGSRVRWRVLSAPLLSAVEVYDAQTPNTGYLPPKPCNGALLVPDTHGTYVLEAVEESFASHIPHYSNDPTNALEEWTETATEEYTVYAGQRAKRTFGEGQHTVELVTHVIAKSGSQGVLTYWHDRDRAPVLQNPSSDEAASAMAASSVREVMEFYGGKGFPYTDDLIAVNGTFCQSPFVLIGLLSSGLNLHRTYTTNAVHGSADAANLMGAVAVPTDLAGLCTYANTFETNITAHAALGATVHPNGADTAFSMSSASATTLSTAILKIREIAREYALHRVRGGELTPTVHSSPGDSIPNNRGPWWVLPLSATVAQAISYVIELATAYDEHCGTTTVVAAYHNAADADNEVLERTPTTWPDLISQVNTFADYLEAHATNIVGSTRVAAATHYHGTVGTACPDHGCKIPIRASDKATAVQTVDLCLWAFLHHVDRDEQWHGGLNAGAAHVRTSGATNRLQLEFMRRLSGESIGVPPNLLTAVEDIVKYGGFTIG